MKKVTDLSSTECIQCETQEQWNKILTLDPFNSCLINAFWTSFKSKTVYFPNKSGYCDIEYAQDNGYTIYPASDFLEPDFEWGEEIEVSVDNVHWNKKIFVALNPKSEEYKFVTVTEKGGVYFYKYARKIQQAKPIPEYTMEQLMDRVGHEFKIKK